MSRTKASSWKEPALPKPGLGPPEARWGAGGSLSVLS